MPLAIQVRGLEKRYRLGVIGAKTLRDDVQRWWALKRGRPDPLAKVTRGSAPRTSGVVLALDGIDMDVEQGSVVGIIGRNGAGKSTLLKILSRITAPTAGEVRLRGRVASLLEVGTGFHPELTGRENIYLNGSILGMRRREIDQRLDQIIDFSEISEYVDTPVKRYSSGMRVRLAFSVAAHLDPEILLVDEVLAVGDASFQRKCLGKMDHVAKGGRTVVFVSHVMPMITNLCPEAILLEDGKVRVRGPSDDVVDAYIAAALEDQVSHVDVSGEGTEAFRIERIQLLDAKGDPIVAVGSGEALRVRIDYSSNLPRLSNVVVSLNFRDIRGAPLFACFSRHSRAQYLNLPPNGTLECRVSSVPLLPGDYTVGYFCKANEELLLGDLELFRLQVVDRDFFGTGKLPRRQMGPFLIRHAWHVEDRTAS
ncbi:MAG TPA: ABC transporter ATP-binding protein [Longimicrobiales bacterium]|jgi:lipopolysaccharide transport system ATP-binding protein